MFGDPSHSHARRLSNAVLDNSAHASVAALQWMLLTRQSALLREYGGSIPCFLAACMGSFIDLDHFLMARSISLEVTRWESGVVLVHIVTLKLPRAMCSS